MTASQNDLDDLEEVTEPAPAGGMPLEPPAQAIRRLEEENDALKDRFARLAAEYDNFRKRTLKEREELTSRAQGAFAGRLLDELDDIERLLSGDPAAMTVESLYQGMELLGRKLWKELELVGLERIDPAGLPFNPEEHEAVATTLPTEPEQDHTVCRTFQVGYRFKGTLLRPARVQVYSDPGQA
ncbi:MAG: nucleotide exchange factor GrpE [Gemmatimonadales bacterium]